MLRAACLIACAGLCSFASAQDSEPAPPSAQAEAPAPERPAHKAAGKSFPKRKASARKAEPPPPFVNDPDPPAAVAPAPGPEQAVLPPPGSGEPRELPALQREVTVEATPAWSLDDDLWSEYWLWILAMLALAVAALAWWRRQPSGGE